MVHFVVDAVEDHPDAGALPLAERGVFLLEAMRRDGLPDAVELFGVRIPLTQQLGFGSRFAIVVGPLPRRDTARDRDRHAEHLVNERAERAHAGDGVGEELVLRKGVDHPARDAAVSLPGVEELVGGDDGGVGHCEFSEARVGRSTYRGRGGSGRLHEPSAAERSFTYVTMSFPTAATDGRSAVARRAARSRRARTEPGPRAANADSNPPGSRRT